MKGNFTINGTAYNLEFNSSATLLHVLRDNGFTEVKNGCEIGTCGSCAVVLNDKLILSCQTLAGSAIDSEIITTKGLGNIHNPHPIHQAYIESGAVQCGFCIPGKVLATYALLKEIPNPSENEIKEALDGHLCRCTGYVKTIDAVKLAAEKMGGKNE